MQTCSKIFRSLTIAAIFVFFAAAIGHRAMAEIVLPATHSVQKIPLAVYPGGDGAFAPGDPDTLYFGGGEYYHGKVYALDISEPVTTPTQRVWANGGLRTGQALAAGDNVLNGEFGNVAGLAFLDPNTAVVVDNDKGTSATLGDTLFLCRDLNGDGDCLDIVATPNGLRAEVDAFTSPIPGIDGAWGGFSGAQIERAPDGSLLLVTADGDPFSGMALGEVLRVAKPEETTSTITIFADYGSSPVSTITLHYGGGMDFLPDGSAVVGNSDLNTGQIFRMEDLNSDGDALDAGEAELLVNLPHCVFDLTVGSDAMIYASTNSPFGDPDPKHLIYRVDPNTKTYEVFCDLTPETFYVTTILFDSKTAPFSHTSHARLARLCVLDGGFLRIITPREPSGAIHWEKY